MKKRLLGAVVLIALAVIFVPMLLPGHPDAGQQSVGVNIPPEPDGAMQTRVLKVGADSASAGPGTAAAIHDPDHVALLNLENPAGRAAAANSATLAGATRTQLTPVPAPASVAKPPATSGVEASSAVAKTAPPSASAVAGAAPAPSVPAASANPAPIPGGPGAAAGTLYTVNLGIYADHASAEKLVANARRQGFTALATPETFQGKPVTRVRVGPFPDRAAAEAARLKLKGSEHVSMAIDASTVDQSGNAPASAVAANKPGAWAVQLAAFGDQSSADKLRDRLRDQGFDGYVDSVTTTKGKLWRVRAGPFASRDAAAGMRGQIAKKLKISGDIVSE